MFFSPSEDKRQDRELLLEHTSIPGAWVLDLLQQVGILHHGRFFARQHIQRDLSAMCCYFQGHPIAPSRCIGRTSKRRALILLVRRWLGVVRAHICCLAEFRIFTFKAVGTWPFRQLRANLGPDIRIKFEALANGTQRRRQFRERAAKRAVTGFCVSDAQCVDIFGVPTKNNLKRGNWRRPRFKINNAPVATLLARTHYFPASPRSP